MKLYLVLLVCSVFQFYFSLINSNLLDKSKELYRRFLETPREYINEIRPINDNNETLQLYLSLELSQILDVV